MKSKIKPENIAFFSGKNHRFSRKRAVIFSALTLFMVMIAAVMGMLVLLYLPYSPSQSAMTALAETENGYWVELREDRLLVYQDGKEGSLVSLPVSEKLLREKDRKSLQKGICVETLAEALSLVEDFGS